jgi:hypothetical protein
MSDKNIEPKVSFWQTMPGCITAIAGLASVVIAGIATLSAAGFIKAPFSATATPPSVLVAAPASSSNSVVESAPVAANTNPPPATNTAFPVVLPIVFDFDNQGPLLDTICNSIQQDMSFFGEDLWRENDQLFGAGLNCDLGFELNIQQTGLYQVKLYATYAPDFGRLRLAFTRGSTSDNIFNIDLHDSSVRPTGVLDLGDWHFTAGEKNHFILVLNGKNDASTDYKFGLDYMTLEYKH